MFVIPQLLDAHVMHGIREQSIGGQVFIYDLSCFAGFIARHQPILILGIENTIFTVVVPLDYRVNICLTMNLQQTTSSWNQSLMRSMTTGTLPASALRQLVADGYIRAESGIADDQIQPASLDLVLAAEAYRMPGSVLALPGEKMRELIERWGLEPLSL